MKKFYKLKAFAVALIIAAAGFVPAVAYGNDINKYEEEIIEYNLKKSSAGSVQEWIDGDLTRYAGNGSEWYIIALSNHGKYDFSDYNAALNKYLSENESGSASSRLKYALTYVAIGDRTNPYINRVLENSIGEQGIMSLVFGLHLLNNGCVSNAYSPNELIGEILSLQLDDGGWSVTGEYGDVDVTAMTVQALAVHFDDSSVKSSVNSALDFLSARQLENGGYSAYGIENPESTAQVIIALSSLGIDVCDDNRFIKNGNTVFDGINRFRLSDGSFCHKEGDVSDSTATTQVLCASIAYRNMKNGKSFFYVFSKDKNTSEKTTSNTVTSVTTSTQSLLTQSTAAPETETTKTETIKNVKDESDSRFIITSVCVFATLVCVVFIAAKKRKFAVIVIIAAAVIALAVIISDNNNTDTVGSVTISINCDSIKDKNKSHIPENGIILEETEFEISDGDTVYDILAEACRENDILFSSNMGYIEGINNIYEMDFGKSSGWIYFVNGESPSVGCGSYVLSDGDEIQWCYTCDLGKDLDIGF